MDFESIQDELETFYKVKGRYSNSADLIRSVISKTLKVVKEKQLHKPVRVSVCPDKVIIKPPLMIYEHKSNPEPQ